MIIQPWSPDPDKYADECQPCNGAGIVGLNYKATPLMDDGTQAPWWDWHYAEELCPDCGGTGMQVDWSVVEPALLGERQ